MQIELLSDAHVEVGLIEIGLSAVFIFQTNLQKNYFLLFKTGPLFPPYRFFPKSNGIYLYLIICVICCLIVRRNRALKRGLIRIRD